MSVQGLRRFVLVAGSLSFVFFLVFQSQEALGDKESEDEPRFESYDDCIAQGGTHEFCSSLIYPGDPPTPTWTATPRPTATNTPGPTATNTAGADRHHRDTPRPTATPTPTADGHAHSYQHAD